MRILNAGDKCTQLDLNSKLIGDLFLIINVFFVLFERANTFERSSHATADDARKVVNRFIAKLGYNPANYNIADGCGLSLYDYLSPELEVGLLKYAYENKQLFNLRYREIGRAHV